MRTQHWSLEEKHPLSSTATLYLPREKGGRSLRPIKQEYKLIKIKAPVKLHDNSDPMMTTVQQFEERLAEKGFSSLIKDPNKFADELGIALKLNNPEPSCCPLEAPEVKIKGQLIKKHLKKAVNEKLVEKIKDQPWHGKLPRSRWQVLWIVGIMELYEQLTPT